MDFKGKVVIVTGASSGIGAVTAIKLTQAGANVVLVGRNDKKLDGVIKQCTKGTTLKIIAELSDPKQLSKIIEKTIEKFGKIDVLVNNAGFGKSAPIGTKDAIDVYDEIMAVNLRSVVILTQLALPHLEKSKGNIVNISSVAAIKAADGMFWQYNISKAGLDHFSRSMAAALASKGIRVNVVNPGPVKTDFFDNMGIDNPNEFLHGTLTDMTLLNRVSDAEEIADIIIFLTSNKARGVTGACWVADNGYLLK